MRTSINSNSPLEYQAIRLLTRRFHQAKFRTSKKAKPSDRRTYRGIKFEFPSARAAAEYMLAVCGPPSPGMTIDRIDGRKGYASGNLRYLPLAENLANRRFKCRDQFQFRSNMNGA